MRDAKAAGDNQPPAKSGILGSMESVAGRATGCEGMVDEGEQRKPGGPGSEETSGTG